MEEVNSDLADEGVPFHARPIQAVIQILNKYKTSGPLVNAFIKSINYPVTAINLNNHVNEWYSSRYEDTLNIDLSPGRFPILIDGAPFQCKIPYIIGKAMIVAGKSVFDNPAIVNAVDFITDLPSYVRSMLSSEIEGYLQSIFITCLEASKDIKKDKCDLSISAESDAITSCDLICCNKPNPSLSAWHSLQFAEKVLKKFISQTKKYPHTHKIEELRDKAIEVGYYPDPCINWQLFNFPPAVRYEPNYFNTTEAVAINHEAWRIGYNVLKHL